MCHRVPVTLPGELHPVVESPLVRLGGKNDGGYVVAKDSLKTVQLLLGFGVGFDWSFERDFLEHASSLGLSPKIVCFDHTLTGRRWVKSMILALAEGPWSLVRQVRLYLAYRRFFHGRGRKAEHRLEKIGARSRGGTDLDSLLDGGSRNVFVRCDIEGSEYRLLEQFIDHAESLTGLVMEMHDCDLHMPRILDFVRRFPLKLAHVHCNNSGGLGSQRFPVLIELTFKRSSEKDGPHYKHLPCDLDAPNVPSRPDYDLVFLET